MKVDFVNLKRNLDDNYTGGCQSILEPKISEDSGMKGSHGGMRGSCGDMKRCFGDIKCCISLHYFIYDFKNDGCLQKSNGTT